MEIDSRFLVLRTIENLNILQMGRASSEIGNFVLVELKDFCCDDLATIVVT
jgi:hypothetical protein